MSKQLNLPHVEFFKNHKIDIESSTATPAFKRLITKFDKLLIKYNENTDEAFKNTAGAELEKISNRIMDDIPEEFPDLAHKIKPADKPKDDKPKDDKPKDDKPKDDKPKDDKPKDDKPKDDKPKDDKPKGANPYNLNDKQIESKKIIDKLFESAKNGEITVPEKKLIELGFDTWSYLGFVTGKLGPYHFKATSMEDWLITKTDKQ